jgi:hypothetical protein
MAINTLKREALQGLVDDIFTTRKITRQGQHELMQLLLSQPDLGRQEKDIVNQVFDAIQRGRLRIVD